jgi:hypothetical protein
MALARYEQPITDVAGNLLLSATVEVRLSSGGGLASLYSDRTGSTPLGNPFSLSPGDNGIAAFHVAGGAYDITVTAPGSLTGTRHYVGIGTASELDAGAFILTGVAPTIVASRSALKGLDTTIYSTAVLSEAGRAGTFVWRTGDYSAQITADALEGVYVKANAIASSSGAWVRQYNGPLMVTWFGADASLASAAYATNQAAIQAAIDLLPASGGDVMVPSGTFFATNINLGGTGGGRSNCRLLGPGLIKKPDHADLTTDADRKSDVVYARTGDGHSVIGLKVEGNLSRGGLTPPYCTKHQLGDVFGSVGRVISTSAAGTSSVGASNDRIFVITLTGTGHTSSASNISVDLGLGYVTEVTSSPYNESTGAGYLNAYGIDNDFAYRAGIYMNGQSAAMKGVLIEGCDVTDAVYGGVLIGAGPLFASEAYNGTLGARIANNYVRNCGATLIGGGKKVEATIIGNRVGGTDSSGIRCDEGSDYCTIVGNSIDCDDIVNSNGGVSIYKSDGVVVVGNIITNTSVGVAITNSDFVVVAGNQIFSVGYGIAATNLDNGAITGNSISDTTADGISLTAGSQNRVFANAQSTIGGAEITDSSTGSIVMGNNATVATEYAGSAVTPQVQINALGAAASYLLARYSNDAGPARFFFGKSKAGTVGAHSATTTSDQLGAIAAAGNDGSQFRDGAHIVFEQTAAITSNKAPARIRLETTDGSGAVASRLSVEANGSIAMTGSFNTIIDTNRLYVHRSFTVGTLPSAGTAGRTAFASNGRMFDGAGVKEGAGSGTGGLVVDNGTNWKVAGTNSTAVS